MVGSSCLVRLVVVAALLAAPSGWAQDPAPPKDSLAKPAKDSVSKPAPIWDATTPVEVTLTTNIRQIRRDKQDSVPWRSASLSYAGPNGDTIKVPLKVRTRGIWRLRHCEFPPLRLNFAGETSKRTLFARLDKPKLVNYCRDNDHFEQYVLQEYQLYRIYKLLTPLSHETRLLRLTYVDSATGRVHARRYAFLMEDLSELAARFGGNPFEVQGVHPDELDHHQATLFAVFQYLIGNTDWSGYGLHNVELVAKETSIFPVAYDFDFAGAVNATYAVTDTSLSIRRVRDRLYRGFCRPDEHYAPVFALFNEKKEAIYGLYRDEIGQLLKPNVVKATLSYFDDFYKIINDPRSARRHIIEACLGRR